MQQVSLLLFQFVVFLFISIACFYLPGYVILKKVKKQLSEPEIIVLSFSLGFILFLINLIVWGFLQMRFMAYIPIGMCLLWVIYTDQFNFFKPIATIFKYKLVILMLVISILIQGFINFPSGLNYGDGLLFWSSQGHDGLWHVSLMEEVKKSFPLQNPLFAGEPVYNYHYFVDLIMGEFVRLFPFISSLDFYFRFFPVLLSILIGLGSFAFVSRWKNSYSMGIWAIFFTTLCGSFGYIVTYLRNGVIFGGETVFWASQNNSILGNPPHAIAFTFILSFLVAFFHYLKDRKWYWFVLCLLIGGLLSGFKVSGGFVLLAGLGLAAVADIVFNKTYKTLFLFLPLAVFNYIVFKLLTHGGESFLIWQPWWFIRTMVVARLDWIDLEHKRQFYLDRGGFRGFARVFEYELIAFLIFFAGNLGMRLIGFVAIVGDFFRKKIYRSPLELLLLGALISGFMMPMLFIQKGISYNNIQFIQYFFLFVGFYAAVTVGVVMHKLKNRTLQIIVGALIVALSLPTALGNLNEFYGPGTSPLAKVSTAELNALSWLRNNTDQNAIVLVSPYDKFLKDKYDYQPKPIFAWYSTSYVAAIGSRRTFLSAEEQVDITDYPLRTRLEPLKEFFMTTDTEKQKAFLDENNISYIYLPKDEKKSELDILGIGLQKAYENDEVEILKVL